MADHTPTPWKMVSEPNFENGITYTSVEPVTPDEATMRPLAMADGSYHVCRTTHTAAQHKIALHRANAAFIVRACNNHDALVAALTKARARIHYLGAAHRDPKHFDSNERDFLPEIDAALQEARR